MIYMICYDICDPKRLHKTAKLLEDHGIRIQKSFFQSEISKDQLRALIRQILDILDLKHDLLYVYPLCEACTSKAMSDGTGEIMTITSYEIH